MLILYGAILIPLFFDWLVNVFLPSIEAAIIKARVEQDTILLAPSDQRKLCDRKSFRASMSPVVQRGSMNTLTMASMACSSH